MKNVLRLEEALQLLGVIYYLLSKDVSWYFYVLLLIGPDVSMLGYLIGERAGAWAYNLFHHKGVAVLVLMLGWVAIEPWIILVGMVLFGHACLDRTFGMGLKYERGFRFTHLGDIGQK